MILALHSNDPWQAVLIAIVFLVLGCIKLEEWWDKRRKKKIK